MSETRAKNRLRAPVRIGIRPSRLALKQAEEIAAMLGGCGTDFVMRVFHTSGDDDKVTPIPEIDGSDFFTDSIEKALTLGEIDMAVHSAKDLPDRIPDGLVIAAVTESIDPYDVLVSGDNSDLRGLPQAAVIATSSLRRKEQLRRFRPDFRIVDIRGNIEERLEKLDSGNMDGIVIAAAGLIRLGLEDRITQKIDFDILRPHPLQGSLAVEIRRDDEEMYNMVRKLDAGHICEKR